VANHAEQDHSGAITFVAEKYGEAKIVVSPKCKDMLIEHLHVAPERLVTVADG
jgi:flavorubredoxin